MYVVDNMSKEMWGHEYQIHGLPLGSSQALFNFSL